MLSISFDVILRENALKILSAPGKPGLKVTKSSYFYTLSEEAYQSRLTLYKQ